MFPIASLSFDAQAIVLACTSLGLSRPIQIRPFGPRGWAKLSGRLDRRSTGPGALIGAGGDQLAALLGDVEAEDLDRLERLLGRSGQLGFEVQRLQERGIWIRTIVDEGYPTRFIERLGGDAPPVLFGSGDPELLLQGGVAIVGSRDVDEHATELTGELASSLARGETTVISGGARGVDQIATQAAFAAGGVAIGVLPEGIERRIRESSTRAALAEGRAVVISPYHPSAGFSAGAAMARNKLVYALADVAVVVSSADGSGGTWAGALEALAAAWVPVLVRHGPDVPRGNQQLLALGARPVDLGATSEAIDAPGLLRLAGPAVRAAEAPTPYEQQHLALTER